MDSIAKILRMAEKETGKTAEQLAAEAEQTPHTKHVEHIEQIELPLLPEDARATANSLLRCSLFAATKRGARPYLKRKKLASLENISVTFTGAQLDQADLDVYQQCIYLLAHQGHKNTIKFSANAFLKSINRHAGKSDHEWLKDAFARLVANSIEISDGKKTYFGSLIAGGKRNEETGFYEIELNGNLKNLYTAGNWSSINTEERKALKGKSLALWLHAFYSTHNNPYPYTIGALHRLSGSEAEPKEFKRGLEKAIEEVNKETNWFCEIQENKLYVFKNAQQLIAAASKQPPPTPEEINELFP